MTVGGKRMPLDPDPSPEGTVVPVTDPTLGDRARVLTGTELPAQEPAWVAHWATCPDSAQYRRRQTALAPRCKVCEGPMDAQLARLERWTTHPSCDPRPHRPRSTE
jgi:hypothetical protein